MKLKIFAVFDSVAKAYLPVFGMSNEALAIRAFANQVNEPKSNFHVNAADFTLFCLGEMEDETGVIEPNGVVKLCNGLEVKKSEHDIN